MICRKFRGTSNLKNVALIESYAEFCAIYARLSSRNFLFSILARILRCATFLAFFLCNFFQPGALETKKTSEVGNAWEIWNKHGGDSKLILADINKFLSYLFDLKLLNQYNVQKSSIKYIWKTKFRPWILNQECDISLTPWLINFTKI